MATKEKSSRRIEGLEYTIERKMPGYFVVRCTYSFNGENKALLTNVSDNLFSDSGIDMVRAISEMVAAWEDADGG